MSLFDRPVVAYVATALLALVIVSPVLAKTPKDSFPLSTFPMFAEGRKDANVTVDHAVAIDGEGNETPIPPPLIGSDEVLQARATIGRAIKRGSAAAKDLCVAIGERLVKSSDFAGTKSIELRTTRLDAVGYFSAEDEASRPAPLSVKRHARCAVDTTQTAR